MDKEDKIKKFSILEKILIEMMSFEKENSNKVQILRGEIDQIAESILFT